MKKIIFIFSILCFSLSVAEAQQQVMYTQYMYNKMGINPAFTGNENAFVGTALIREQWAGWAGAPSTQTLTLQSPIGKTRVGAGFMFLRDQIGVVKQNAFYGSFSYKVPLTQSSQVAFGIQAGAGHYKGNYNELETDGDVSFAVNANAWFPSFGFGVVYSTENMYLGFSIPQLNNYTISESGGDPDSKLVRHYFATGGYRMDISPQLSLQPSFLVKMVEGAPVEVDLTINALLSELVWVGVSWRSMESVDAMFMLRVSESLEFGYAYDFTTSKALSRINVGSHEIALRFRMPKKVVKFITPRYF